MHAGQAGVGNIMNTRFPSTENQMRHSRVPEAKGTPPASVLEPAQMVALEALLSGQTVTDAAAAAGVNRTTLHRWLREHFHFQAELNAARLALRQASFVRLDALAERALEVLQQSLSTGNDARVAIEVLKGAGLLGGDRQIGATNAEILERETRSDIETRLADLKEKSLFSSLRFGSR
jgi:transposase-like protein